MCPEHLPACQQSRVPRVILHVDMDAFFASVEQRDNPDLRGRPIVVGGGGRRGVVAAASYEARVFGCRAAQSTAEARRLCPHLIVVKPRMEQYAAVSRAVFEILESVTPLIEPLSIDEAFLDVSGSIALFGSGEAMARRLRERIRAEQNLTASVGVAPNKFLAKLASDLRKPDGLVVIEPENIQATLDPLPVSKVYGVGPAAEARLHALGLRTLGQVRACDPRVLEAKLGSLGPHVFALAQGLDVRPVVSGHEARGIGHERTFAHDLREPDEALAALLDLLEQSARRARRAHLAARTVTIKLRTPPYETLTRARTLEAPSSRTETLWEATRALFEAWRRDEGYSPLRLVGVRLSHFSPEGGEQDSLFAARDRTRLDAAADAITERFGAGSITRARTLERPRRPAGPWGPEA